MKSLLCYGKEILCFSLLFVFVACAPISQVSPPTVTNSPPAVTNTATPVVSASASPPSPTVDLPSVTPTTPLVVYPAHNTPITVSTIAISATKVTPNSLRLHNQKVQSMALDDTYIYWVLWEDSRHIYRYPLDGGQIELVAQTEFQDGKISLMPLQRSGDWLFFIDTPVKEQGITWKLYALDVQDNTRQVILDAVNDIYSWPGPCVDSDSDWIVWSQTKYAEAKECTETILARMNVHTQEYYEIDRTCAAPNWMWLFPHLSGDYFVAEQDHPDTKGGGNDIYLYHIPTSQMRALTDDQQSSMPGIAMPWVIWKAAPRFSFGPTALYNVETGEYRLIPGQHSDPFIHGRWVYWKTTALTPLYVYDIETDQLLEVATPGANENIEARTIYGNMIAWSRDLEFEHTAPSDSMIEWRVLP